MEEPPESFTPEWHRQAFGDCMTTAEKFAAVGNISAVQAYATLALAHATAMIAERPGPY